MIDNKSGVKPGQGASYIVNIDPSIKFSISRFLTPYLANTNSEIDVSNIYLDSLIFQPCKPSDSNLKLVGVSPERIK